MKVEFGINNVYRYIKYMLEQNILNYLRTLIYDEGRIFIFKFKVAFYRETYIQLQGFLSHLLISRLDA